MVSSEGVSGGRGETRARRPRVGVSSAKRGCECTGVDSCAIDEEAEAIIDIYGIICNASRVVVPRRTNRRNDVDDTAHVAFGHSTLRPFHQPWPGSQAAHQNQTKTQIHRSEKTGQSAGKRGTLISLVWTPQRSSLQARRAQSARRRGKPTSRTAQRAG
jgi:hypothetical protein